MGDVVTQAQQQVNNMCSLMFNFTGALQRDAPKVAYVHKQLSVRYSGLGVVDV
eukprot:evm.model.scf_456.2 EVM.evm.TU.scf_456.2   scf_456:7160-9843(-)